MIRPRLHRAAGVASVEFGIVAAILLTVLLAGRSTTPQLLARALETAIDAVVSAVGAELP